MLFSKWNYFTFYFSSSFLLIPVAVIPISSTNIASFGEWPRSLFCTNLLRARKILSCTKLLKRTEGEKPLAITFPLSSEEWDFFEPSWIQQSSERRMLHPYCTLSFEEKRVTTLSCETCSKNLCKSICNSHRPFAINEADSCTLCTFWNHSTWLLPKSPWYTSVNEERKLIIQWL